MTRGNVLFSSICTEVCIINLLMLVKLLIFGLLQMLEFKVRELNRFCVLKMAEYRAKI